MSKREAPFIVGNPACLVHGDQGAGSVIAPCVEERTEEDGAAICRSILECWLMLARDLYQDEALDADACHIVARVGRLLADREASGKLLRLGLFMAAAMEVPVS